METKRCTKCEIEKPIAEFYWHKRQNRHRVQCKQCTNSATDRYYAAHRDKILVQQRVYNAEHREQKRATNRAYRKANLERIRERERIYRENHRKERARRNLAWRRANPDKVQEYGRRTHARYRDKILDRKAEYRRLNPEEVRESSRKWREANPDKCRLYVERRRARKRGASVNDFTHDDWQALLTAFQHRCAYCHMSAPLTQDHLVPLSRKGDHTLTNVVPACKRCNSSKGTLTALEFFIRQLEVARRARARVA